MSFTETLCTFDTKWRGSCFSPTLALPAQPSYLVAWEQVSKDSVQAETPLGGRMQALPSPHSLVFTRDFLGNLLPSLA